MKLILALVDDLDVPSAAKAQINVFTLKRADAQLTAALLNQLFFGGGTTGTTGGGGGFGGGGGGSWRRRGRRLWPCGAELDQYGSLTNSRPMLSPSGGTTIRPTAAQPDYALRIAVDDRTNSIVVAGTPGDLDTIAAIIARLEDSEVRLRVNEVVKLRNSAAADVATALHRPS